MKYLFFALLLATTVACNPGAPTNVEETESTTTETRVDSL